MNEIGASLLLADVEYRNTVLQGIDERLTRVGPRRCQGWTVFLDGKAIAYYDRDPIPFTQTFQIITSPYGHALGFTRVDTEDPYHEMCRQYGRINADSTDES